MQDAHSIGHLAHHCEVVTDEQIGEPELFLQPAHQLENLSLDGNVESGGGFVADDEFGLARKRAGNRDALALATGKFVGIFAHGDRSSRTRSSRSATRSAISPGFLAMPSARMGSAIISPTRQRGLRLA